MASKRELLLQLSFFAGFRVDWQAYMMGHAAFGHHSCPNLACSRLSSSGTVHLSPHTSPARDAGRGGPIRIWALLAPCALRSFCRCDLYNRRYISCITRKCAMYSAEPYTFITLRDSVQLMQHTSSQPLRLDVRNQFDPGHRAITVLAVPFFCCWLTLNGLVSLFSVIHLP